VKVHLNRFFNHLLLDHLGTSVSSGLRFGLSATNSPND